MSEEVESVAIVGMTGRFPGARNVAEFWKNLCNGVESLTVFSPEELVEAGHDPAMVSQPNYVRAARMLADYDKFDAAFFSIPPREAEILDPQFRFLLECAWEALEDAGYDPETFAGLVGLFAGIARTAYLLENIVPNYGRLVSSVGDWQIMLGNHPNYLTNRVSYKLNLKGPSLTVQTACSTSLVATHLACQSLLTYQCDMALAGGVSVAFLHKNGYVHQEGSLLSPDGHCRPFDAQARGTIFSDGVGLVVLKRLSDALADGDHIYALIRGSAINNDGSFRVGFTAPSAEGQMEVVSMAQAAADIDPETISYIEAHGTGTALGDPIELDALTRAFREYTAKKQFCAIGSAKGNIGHADAAAGAAGLIKTALALKHRVLPPSINYETPNPEIDLANSPFYVNTRLSEWRTDGQPRRAGVSAFGLGGTNAHVVLEEAPNIEPSGASRRYQLLLLSAHTETALEKMTDNLAHHLRVTPDLKLADAAYTLHVGRRAFDQRRMLVCRDLNEATSALERRDPQRVLTSTRGIGIDDRPVAFMFPGLGDQYVNMARGLYQDEVIFREHLDRCSELLIPHLGLGPEPALQGRPKGLDLRDVLFPDGVRGSEGEIAPDQGVDLRQMLGRDLQDGDATVAPGDERLRQTRIAHPAIFAIEYALAQLWMSWGVKPGAMIGYSLGEYVAACLAGVFSLEEGLRIVLRRAEIIETLPEGAMLAVALPEEDVAPLLGESLSLSAVNGPQMCVASGPPQDVAKLAQRLGDEGVICRQLRASRAFHSSMVQPIADDFRAFMETVELEPPQIPYISNVTGTWITPEQATDPGYWATHTRQTIRFADGIQTLWAKDDHVLLEVGVGQTLGSLALQHPAKKEVADPVVLSSLPAVYDQQPDIALLLRSLGQLWLAGVPIDWSGFYAYERRIRCALPTYPFERRRYWIDRFDAPQPAATSRTGDELPAGKQPDLADWFYVPTWRRIPLVGSNHRGPQEHCWLFFVDECGLGTFLVERLQGQGADVTVVKMGEAFRRVRDGVYTIDPHAGDDYAALIKHLYQVNKPPGRVVHLWSVTSEGDGPLEAADGREQQLGFYSLLFLTQALGGQPDLKPAHLWVVSDEMQDVLGGETVRPGKATLLGPCKVIPQEYEQITCSSVDVALPAASMEPLVDRLLTEFLSPDGEESVAYRDGSRWVQTFDRLRLEDVESGVAQLRENGVYLITGGFGGLGAALAARLAETVQARLILVGRTSLPPREDWPALLADGAPDERVHARVRQVLDLEKLGADVMAPAADAANREQMQQMLDEAHERFGPINGVFHVAGVPGEGLMQFKTLDTAKQVLAPKLQGTLVLDALLQDEPLDFLVLYSSISTVTGRLGEVDYCAANAFLDAYAHYKTNRCSIPTISINWGPWQWDAWEEALLSAMPQVYEELKQMRETYGITFDEGDEALWRILAARLPQVVVSTQDLPTVIQQWRSLTSANLLEQVQAGWAGREAHPRPNLRTPYVPPRNETEEKIAGIWADCLAIEKVGIHDHFFELGGNSLMGLVIISRLEQELGVKLTAASLYEGPTVSTLYEVLYPEQEEKATLARERERGELRKQLRRRRRRR